jgi:hypothetical protein
MLISIITSGRREEYTVFSILVLFASNFTAVILFILHYLLPKKLIAALGFRLMGYWYNSRQ